MGRESDSWLLCFQHHPDYFHFANASHSQTASMRFGVGFGDLVQAGKLAWTVYNACKDSSENFQRLSSEVASLHVVLRETEDNLGEFPGLDTSRVNRLQILTDGRHETLNELEKLIYFHMIV
ncbi:hypothetical protein F5Y18DRAFT_429395 [Xylariaceae sp. FL1019]|nr:hypothetical protein F5Y18DRAFT_429395 [Xylariaceae sp. FL1019]